MKLGRYRVTHRVRPYGSTSNFVESSRILYAGSGQEAIELSREEWHAAKHETAGVSVELTDAGDDVTTYMGIQFGPRS